MYFTVHFYCCRTALVVQFLNGLFLRTFPRGMLSAAHILAMNAKNLLDVIDHVRIKHPSINVLFSGSDETDTFVGAN